MKNVAFTALCIGSLGLFACGGGSGDDVDGGPVICGDDICAGDEATTCPEDCTGVCNNDGTCQNADGENNTNCPADCDVAACNAIANTGCEAGQKCTYIIESTEPLLGRTDCADNGTMTEGQACTGAGTAEGGVDDCAGGLFCNDSVCTEICDALDNTNCDENEACVEFNGLFDDAENTGLCQPGCNPVAAGGTGCPTGEGCYVRTDTGRGSCAGDCRANPQCNAGFTGSTTAGMNNCVGDANWGSNACNCECLNCCAPGFGCLLNNMPMNATASVCAWFCDTTGTVGAPTCGDMDPIQVTANSCRRISEFYSNTMNVPAAVGMCVDGEIWHCAGCINDTDTGCTAALPEDCDCIMGTEPGCNQ